MAFELGIDSNRRVENSRERDWLVLKEAEGIFGYFAPVSYLGLLGTKVRYFFV